MISSIAPQRGAGLTAIGTAKDSARVDADKKAKVKAALKTKEKVALKK